MRRHFCAGLSLSTETHRHSSCVEPLLFLLKYVRPKTVKRALAKSRTRQCRISQAMQVNPLHRALCSRFLEIIRYTTRPLPTTVIRERNAPGTRNYNGCDCGEFAIRGKEIPLCWDYIRQAKPPASTLIVAHLAHWRLTLSLSGAQQGLRG